MDGLNKISAAMGSAGSRPLLHLHLLAHPHSPEANMLASTLMRRFVEPPASGGLRIPVFFTPDRGCNFPPKLDERHHDSSTNSVITLNAAQHTIILVLADECMLRSVTNIARNVSRAWATFVQCALDLTPLDSSPHHVLPVALDQEGFRISDSHHVLPAILKPYMKAQEATDRRTADVSFHIAARAIQLLEYGKVPAMAANRMKAPVTIFLSHAKVDLRDDRQDPVRQTHAILDELPVETWYDASEIVAGQLFSDSISAGIQDCSIMLAFHTDQYSSRPWCRREVLEAKRLGAHILIVDALELGEPRSFPYIGNVPTVRWRFKDSDIDARRVIDRAVLEALRFKYNRLTVERSAEPGDIVLASAPEALTLANAYASGSVKDRDPTFLYPDPPLGREELQILLQLSPKARFLTPLTKIALWHRPTQIATIAVSISESDDLRKYGLSRDHLETLTDEIHLYLLLAGLKIAYGGALNGDFSKASNFTLRLFELVRAYSKLAEGVQAQPLEDAILNIAPWPLWLNYGENEWKLFAGTFARYEAALRPDLPWQDDEVFPRIDGVRSIEPDAPHRRYALARGLTIMRTQLTALSQAHLLSGGRFSGFAGIVPGVVEEAWLSLMQKKPLFVLGGFGGAARAVADRLVGIDRAELTDAFLREHIHDYDAVVALYAQNGGNFCSIEQMDADITSVSSVGLARLLNNGLNEAENIEMMYSTDPQHICQFILTGLGRL